MTGTKWREISALAVSTVLSTLGGAKFLSLPPTPASIIVISKIRNKNNYKHDRSIDSIADEIYVFFIYLKINRKEKYTAYFSKDAFNYTHNFNCERNSFENDKKKKRGWKVISTKPVHNNNDTRFNKRFNVNVRTNEGT